MNNKLNEVVIIAAARTPIGAYKGSLKNDTSILIKLLTISTSSSIG